MESSAAEQRYIVYGEDISKMYLWKGGEWGEPSVRYDEPSVKSGISLALTHIPRNALPHFNEETRHGRRPRTERPREPGQGCGQGGRWQASQRCRRRDRRPERAAQGEGSRARGEGSAEDRRGPRGPRSRHLIIPTAQRAKRGGRQAAPAPFIVSSCAAQDSFTRR